MVAHAGAHWGVLWLLVAPVVAFVPLRTAMARGDGGVRRQASSMPRSSEMPPPLSQPSPDEVQARAQRLLDFLLASPEPFHVVKTSAEMLSEAGFQELRETEDWRDKIAPGGKFFFKRNRSSILAFAVGGKAAPDTMHFKVLGAHTDSPALKVKPRSHREGSKMAQVAVECYGGGLWHTWLDRDLSVAGRVIVKEGDHFVEKLVNLHEPILQIPNLCIHLKTAPERESLTLNKEDNLVPLLCSEASSRLSSNDEGEEKDPWRKEQSPLLLSLIAEELGCNTTDIMDWELTLYDFQPAILSGGRREFVTGARLDNLASCFATLEALTSHVEDSEGGFSADEGVSIVALFDHEEVGSDSAQGAGSPLMKDATERIFGALSSGQESSDGGERLRAALARSLVFSIDMAHAVHPNYSSKHEKAHSPYMNQGLVIKANANQRYATNGVTAFLVRELARRADVPLQDFVVRNDCPCGSTIGPIISSNTGMRAIDLGMPQLAMHSCREIMGKTDLTFAHWLFSKFLTDFATVDKSLIY